MSDFSKHINSAKVLGLKLACQEALEALARSATWYTDKVDKIDENAIAGLRDEIDQLEALWKAMKPNAVIRDK